MTAPQPRRNRGPGPGPAAPQRAAPATAAAKESFGACIAIRDWRFAKGQFALIGAVVILFTLLVVLLSGLTPKRGGDNGWVWRQVPVTAQGRLVAIALMVTGIALLGVVTAAIASCSWRRPGKFRRLRTGHQRRSLSSLRGRSLRFDSSSVRPPNGGPEQGVKCCHEL